MQRFLGVTPKHFSEYYSITAANKPQSQRCVNRQKLHDVINNRVPNNTKKSMKWGVSVWNGWCMERDVNIRIMTAKELH